MTPLSIDTGMMVLITDGSDTAGLRTLTDVLDRVEDGQDDPRRIVVIGVGNTPAEVMVLESLANAGYIDASGFDQISAKLGEAFMRADAFANSFYQVRYASPKRGHGSPAMHDASVTVMNNTNDSGTDRTGWIFDAQDFTSVVPELNIPGVTHLMVGDEGPLKAEVLWTNRRDTYSWTVEPSESEGTLRPGASDDLATVQGDADGVFEVTVSAALHELELRRRVMIGELPALTRVSRGLLWEDFTVLNDDARYAQDNLPEAAPRCRAFDHGTLADWRLPTIDELISQTGFAKAFLRGDARLRALASNAVSMNTMVWSSEPDGRGGLRGLYLYAVERTDTPDPMFEMRVERASRREAVGSTLCVADLSAVR